MYTYVDIINDMVYYHKLRSQFFEIQLLNQIFVGRTLSVNHDFILMLSTEDCVGKHEARLVLICVVYLVYSVLTFHS